MPRPATDKRERLTAAAIHLARTTGLEATTLAAIAGEAGVPSGSVYYYFKTKADVAGAVADGVADQLAAARDGLPAEPAAALVALLGTYLDDATAIRAHGSLLATASAVPGDARAHRETLAWIADQFEGLGFARAASEARAVHLLAGVEGGAALAHALDESGPLEREAAHLERWVSNTKA
ncbi:TetR/AcrR family transcriptional regulator [uncultured Demequina sp.]|uniref:TetR/AcrR family transcriptional regulator n=1 Tax=uncultured Demequina sp. TaxID=693499 RepID=UPI0026010BBB|nr:TetR/AcrR family transcriptional regulator [uncultured Demequina sp.]